ncbi:unnamed protein product, partial [Closterium sp. NIES-53]
QWRWWRPVAVAVELFDGEFLAVAKCSCSCVSTTPFHPSSYVSGTLVGVVAVAVVSVAVQSFNWEFLEVAWRSCGGIRTRPLCLSNSVSGTLSVGCHGLVLAARTSFAQEIGMAELLLWLELIRQGVDVFALNNDVILSAMYALSASTEGDYYQCVPPDPSLEAAALGASESSFPGTAPAKALHTFTLDSGPGRCPFLHRSPLSGGSVRLTVRSSPPLVLYELVSASDSVAPPCSYRLVSHQTLQWHNRLGHPSLPRLRGLHSCLLVLGLPRSLPPLPPSPAPPCLPCIEGQQRTAPHSSSFPPTTAPLQTLHMDVWGPARVTRQGHERYFLLAVEDYMRYTTVFPLRSKGQVVDVFNSRSPSPAPRACRIGLVMEVARTSMIHAAAAHFLWPFTVRYAAHQLNLWPRVSLPETSPTLCWIGKVCNASVIRIWGSRAFVRDASANKLYARAIPCVFLGFDVMFDESVPFYRLFPYRSAPPPPPPLFLAPGTPPVDPLPPQVPAPSVAARGAVSGGAASGDAEPRGVESEGAGSGDAELGGEERGGAEPDGVVPRGAESEGAELYGHKR